jgi:hypothetical protein
MRRVVSNGEGGGEKWRITGVLAGVLAGGGILE